MSLAKEPLSCGIGITRWSEGIYERPTVQQVAELARTHGIEACRERWSFVTPDALSHMITAGNRLLRRS